MRTTRALVPGPAKLEYFRDLIYEMVLRDLKLRYKRSSIGIAWSLLNPLAQMLVFTFLFRRVLPLNIPNYPVFVFTGVLVWNWFQTSLMVSCGAVTDNRELVKRPGFPAALLPVIGITTNLIHFLLALPVLFLFIFIGGSPLGLSLLVLPVILAIQFLLSAALGYLVSTAQVRFRDTQHSLGVILLLLFYLTPVFYDASVVPARFQFVYQLNPLVHLIRAYRAILTRGEFPNPLSVAGLAVFAGLLLWLGLFVFNRASDHFAEEL